jgi:hypothetical protein
MHVATMGMPMGDRLRKEIPETHSAMQLPLHLLAANPELQ